MTTQAKPADSTAVQSDSNGHLFITRDALLAVAALKHEDVIVPGLPAPVRVSEMTMTDRDAFDESCYKDAGGGKQKYSRENIRARLLVRSIVDADGNRIFTDADVAVVGKLGSGLTQPLVEAAMRINKLTAAELDEEKKDSARGQPAAP